MIVVVEDFGLLRTIRGSRARTTFSLGLALCRPQAPNRLDIPLSWGTCTYSGRLCLTYDPVALPGIALCYSTSVLDNR